MGDKKPSLSDKLSYGQYKQFLARFYANNPEGDPPSYAKWKANPNKWKNPTKKPTY